MAAPCGVALGLCAMRLTKLQSTGCMASTPDNSFVTTELVNLTLTPVIEAGADTTLTGGCDCVVASYRGTDKLKRFEFEVTAPKLSPAMYYLLMGGTAFSAGGFPVGYVWPTEAACGDTQPAVALEFWVKHWNGDAQDPTYPWIHHVYPQTYWQLGQQQFQNDFAQPTITGFSRKNECWGDGPYGDGPEALYGTPIDISTGTFYYDDTVSLPTDTECDFADVTPGS
ncbi:MAG: hypothetical protein OEV86_13930 [Candidatus Krumholzibacteria bacterium]|nr:hypothetical protein [Candidatus Krumholzibacteria bacterium]